MLDIPRYIDFAKSRGTIQHPHVLLPSHSSEDDADFSPPQKPDRDHWAITLFRVPPDCVMLAQAASMVWEGATTRSAACKPCATFVLISILPGAGSPLTACHQDSTQELMTRSAIVIQIAEHTKPDALHQPKLAQLQQPLLLEQISCQGSPILPSLKWFANTSKVQGCWHRHCSGDNGEPSRRSLLQRQLRPGLVLFQSIGPDPTNSVSRSKDVL